MVATGETAVIANATRAEGPARENQTIAFPEWLAGHSRRSNRSRWPRQDWHEGRAKTRRRRRQRPESGFPSLRCRYRRTRLF